MTVLIDFWNSSSPFTNPYQLIPIIRDYFRVVYNLLLEFINNLLVYIHYFVIQTDWLQNRR